MQKGEELPFVIKRFIVQRLACFDSPKEVIAAVKEAYGLELSRPRVHFYDPTSANGAALSAELKALFFDTRKTFLASIDDIPIANKAVRLRRLDRLAATAESKGNLVLAATFGEMAAKEVGGAYTNKRELSGPDGKPLQTESKVAVVSPEQIANELTGIFGAALKPAAADAGPAAQPAAGSDPVLHPGSDGGSAALGGAPAPGEALFSKE